jgi:hypothetical protein
MSKVTFDGVNKLIHVISSTASISIDVETDIYSEWKRWVVVSGNSQFLQAIRSIGGEPTSPTQYTPKYFFLMNDWKVSITGDECLFQINLYAEDGTSPFIVLSGGAVTNRASDVPIVQSVLEQSLNYGGIVFIDTIDGVAGTTYPTGTRARKVNNLADALNIAEQYSIHNFELEGNLVIDRNVDEYGFWGLRKDETVYLTVSGSYDGTEFNRLVLSGDCNNDRIAATDCYIRYLDNAKGNFQNCGLGAGTTEGIRVGAFADVTFVDLSTISYGNSSTAMPTIDMSNAGFFVGKSINGALRIKNCKNAMSLVSLDYNSGFLDLPSSNTAGTVVVAGVCYVTNGSSGVTVNTSGLASMGSVESSGLTVAEHDHLMATLTQTQANSISGALNSELAVIAGLVQRNQRITNAAYDANNNLLSATLSIYSSAADANSQTNPIKQFGLVATYNGSNQMTDYKVTEL